MVTTLGTAMKELYPELISCAGNFPETMTFDIGFINPDIENWQGDGIANDETEFTAEGLEELESLYEDFCRENSFPTDTVTHVEIAKPEGCDRKSSENIRNTWIISICSSEGDGIDTSLVNGTKEEVKSYLYEEAASCCREEEWECGPESKDDTSEETDEYIYYGPWWNDYHIDFCAQILDSSKIKYLSK